MLDEGGLRRLSSGEIVPPPSSAADAEEPLSVHGLMERRTYEALRRTAHLERRGHGRLPPPRPPFAYYEFSSFLPFGNELWTMSLL